MLFQGGLGLSFPAKKTSYNAEIMNRADKTEIRRFPVGEIVVEKSEK